MIIPNAPTSTTGDNLPGNTITIPYAEYQRLKALDVPVPQPAAPVQAELPSPDDCIVHIYPSDLAKMARNEMTATVASVAIGNPDERSVPLYTAEQMLAALATQQPALATQQPAVQAMTQNEISALAKGFWSRGRIGGDFCFDEEGFTRAIETRYSIAEQPQEGK